jgi:ribonuclease D
VTSATSGPKGAPPLVVETPDALRALCARVQAEPRVALDTEADSLHRFRERVCVVQLSVPGLDAIVDPLAVPDLSPLRDLVDRPEPLLVMHGGDYDVLILSREHGFRFHRVFDTMLAATVLGDERVGLQALVEGAFGVHLSKKHQTADWGKRPFTPDHLDYLRGDTAHLFGLHDLLSARLAEADLVEEAEIEFRRLAARRGVVKPHDPDAWRAMKGADKLDALGRAVAASLFAWRDGLAKQHDVPRFRVMPNEGLVALAARPPATDADVASVVGGSKVVRMGDAATLLEAVAAARATEARGEAPPPEERPRLGAEERARADVVRRREERLRRWRKDEAAARKVPNLVVLPNPALEAMSETPPPSVDALAAMPDVGAKRAARYGAKILELLVP